MENRLVQDAMTANVGDVQVVLVLQNYMPFGVWTEIRSADGMVTKIDDVEQIPKCVDCRELRDSIGSDPMHWAKLVSQMFETSPPVGHELSIGVEHFCGMDVRAMSPWVKGDFLYYITREGLLENPEARVVVHRLCLETFREEGLKTALVIDLQLERTSWDYERKDLERLFD